MRLWMRSAAAFALGVTLPWLAACVGEETEANGPAVVAQNGEAAPAETSPVPAGFARADFHVEGMTCGGCALGTRVALEKLNGVHDADASYDDSRAWALYDPAVVTPEQMMAAIRELGYTPALIEPEAQS